MKKTLSIKIFFIFTVAHFLFLLPISQTNAHSTAVYAGTHLVDLEMSPRSPFVGEDVSLKFRLFDLRYDPPGEDFVLAGEVHEGADGFEIYKTESITVSDGVLEFSYVFEEAGDYDIIFTFYRPEEPDMLRDAFFHIEVRDSRATTIPFSTLIITFVVAGIIGFTISRFFSTGLISRKTLRF